MTSLFESSENQSNRRIRQQRTVILTEDGPYSFSRNQITNITPTGDAETIETNYAVLVEGEAVHDASQILGRCLNPECGRWLTARTFRHCSLCGAVRCLACCHWDEEDQIWLCRECRSRLRRSRALRAVGRLLSAPFVRRGRE